MTTDPQWETALYQGLVWGVLLVSVVVFLTLLVVTAPYGRHSRTGWGPAMPVRAAWMVMELPAVAAFYPIYIQGASAGQIVPLIFAGLWALHYVHRTFVYPLRMYGPRSPKRVPVAVVSMGFLFNVVNAYLNARWISAFGHYALQWMADPRFVIGVTLFVGGYVINRRADARLRKLQAESRGYRIPRGGMHELVSSPNYLGELVEWSGWALATWSPAGLAFVVFTAANLVPRGLAHHRWYHQRFAEYPPERKAIIPFVL